MEVHGHVEHLLPSSPSSPALSPALSFDSSSSDDRTDGTLTPPFSPRPSFGLSPFGVEAGKLPRVQLGKKASPLGLSYGQGQDESFFSSIWEKPASSLSASSPAPTPTTRPPTPPSLAFDFGEHGQFSLFPIASGSREPSLNAFEPTASFHRGPAQLHPPERDPTSQPDIRPAKRRAKSSSHIPTRSATSNSHISSSSSSPFPGAFTPSLAPPPLLRRITAPLPSTHPRTAEYQPVSASESDGQAPAARTFRIRVPVPLPDPSNPNSALLDQGSYPPVAFPPKSYRGPSPFMPPSESPPTIYASQMDRLPALEARLGRLELSIREFTRRRGLEALKNVMLYPQVTEVDGAELEREKGSRGA